MTWSDPVDATANVTAVTAAREKTYVLDNLRAIAEWTSYTPTLSQFTTVTKTVTYGKYRSFGGTVEVIVLLTCTGSGTGNNGILIGLPTTASASIPLATIIGVGQVIDASGFRYQGHAALSSTTSVGLYRCDSSTPGGTIGIDPNFALASTDTVAMHVTYETA